MADVEMSSALKPRSSMFLPWFSDSKGLYLWEDLDATFIRLVEQRDLPKRVIDLAP